jgi:hypothetical protein
MSLPNRSTISPELKGVAESGLVTFAAGKEYLLRLGFDGEKRLNSADLRPDLPLILSW